MRRRGQLSPAGLVGLLVWLGAGYAAALAGFAGLPWGAAVWQGAVCVAAIPVLLFLVLSLIALPKRVHLSSLRALARLTAPMAIGQFALPWAGWSALVRVLNGQGLPWATAWAAGGAIAAFSYLTGLGLIALFRPRPEEAEVTQVEVGLAGLPASFDGYRILHISDLHAGPFLTRADLDRRLAGARRVERDLVAFTGDLADKVPGRAEEAADVLSGLRAPDGVVAVLGNHDIWVGEKHVRAALAERGVRVLVNENVALGRDGARVYVAGINDASYTGRDNLPAALAGIPEGAVVILLSHAPSVIRKAEARRAALVLSGHTHGGQIILPWIGPPHVPSRLGRRFALGLHRVEGQWLFISRGLGEVFPPLRINCPPEIALITLRREPA